MRILVAEDEPGILAFVTRALRAEGYTIDGAADGSQALAWLRQERHDLVVLDLLMPRVDGLSVLRHIRESQPGLPVVIVSARADLSTKLRGFDLGACDYVSKPFALDELIARIRAHLRRARPTDGDDRILRVGSLLLDLTRHQARIAESEAAVDLTDREFRLLLYLGERAGEIVSRERLLAEVWGYHFDPRSNVVEVCIRRVRRKLGSGAPIETVRNAGYRLAG